MIVSSFLFCSFGLLPFIQSFKKCPSVLEDLTIQLSVIDMICVSPSCHNTSPLLFLVHDLTFLICDSILRCLHYKQANICQRHVWLAKALQMVKEGQVPVLMAPL